MSSQAILCDASAGASDRAESSRAADFLELTKPRIAVLELACVAVAALLAGGTDAGTLLATLVGTALVAASASALNQWIERRSDALMDRTAGRPLPQARLTSREVALFGSVLVVAGVALLAAFVNWSTALVGAGTWFLYVCVYTPLKRRSVANTAVGAVAGALPVIMGWTCTGAPLDLIAITLFVIVFLWQFPHFMAIAWLYREQYAAAGLRMLSVVDGSGRRAGAQAVVAALALVPVSMVPGWHLLEPAYLVGAVVLGVAQLSCAAAFLFDRNDITARRLLRASLVYLPALLVLLALSPLI